MSETDAAQLTELKQDILAAIGRWVIVGAGSAIAVLIAIAVQWFGTIARIEKLENWRTERDPAIARYYADQTELAGWRGKIDQQMAQLTQNMRDVKDQNSEILRWIRDRK